MSRKLIYRESDGILLANLPIKSEYKYLYEFETNHILDNTGFTDFSGYRLIDKKFVELSDIERSELRMYGKILTDEERLLNKLKPSLDETRKAENTIEMLSLIQEVI